MRNDLTEIVLIADRSGSMASIKKDAEGGINSFIEKQKQAEGEARFTLVQFNTSYEFVYNGTPIKEVGKYELFPCGNTALNDAIGRAISETGHRLALTPEAERPGQVVVVIVTDGEENSSREYSRATIRQMIEEQTAKYSWKFLYLGANQDAFKEAHSLGISQQMAAAYSVQKSKKAYDVLGDKMSMLRSASIKGQSASLNFSAEERKEVS